MQRSKLDVWVGLFVVLGAAALLGWCHRHAFVGGCVQCCGHLGRLDGGLALS